MIALSLLLAAAAAPHAAPPVVRHASHHVVHRRVVTHIVRRKRRFDTRLHLAPCDYTALGGCATARSRYRLAADDTVSPTAKDRALAQTGTRCALIGQTICPSPRRMILHTER